MVAGRTAVLVTQHGKERVLAPALARVGVTVQLVSGVDTDRFGTFTREIAREGDAYAALARKWAAAGDDVDLVLASEGSFGPHPVFGFVAAGLELVGLASRREAWRAYGRDVSTETNFASASVRSRDEALAFARTAGFPEHALVVHTTHIHKGVSDEALLAALVEQGLARAPEVMLETDMRAHLNPTRMRAIARAADDLVQRLMCACPRCRAPGYGEAEPLSGRPCEACATPTWERIGAVWRCDTCRFEEHRLDTNAGLADPAHCDECNP